MKSAPGGPPNTLTEIQATARKELKQLASQQNDDVDMEFESEIDASKGTPKLKFPDFQESTTNKPTHGIGAGRKKQSKNHKKVSSLILLPSGQPALQPTQIPEVPKPRL
ncbi:hypothetical protein Nepgr_004543 [Nepenthes gracilis]|uniref:Uncharacterized protein n=1 Tax=Nepenthes gracilis TaxID=150966 RepID=A0AAD3S1K6_NEPGR|nr:hypothetical protein Nepgr_004543 [Nepenthes gracilis]